MSGVIHKIGETLNIGGNKKEGEYKGEQRGEHKVMQHGEHQGEYKPDQQHGGAQKEGIMSKVKDKIIGGQDTEEKKKKKKKDKKHEDGHKHGDSSSDSD